jgi:hypothetical protein
MEQTLRGSMLQYLAVLLLRKMEMLAFEWNFNVRISKGENCKNNTNILKFQGFQYCSSVPVLQYLQAVHFLSRFELFS